jgi:hypothetical protein
MRRLVLVSVATLSLVGGVIGTSAVASASTDTTVPSDAATAVNPIVGTWTVTVVSDPEAPPITAAFLSEGVYIEVNTGDVSIGTWEATGPDTATMSYTSTDENGSVTVRASITVDGDNISADFTLEFVGEGAPSGEYGPGHATGVRAVAEPMGTPVGSYQELFSILNEGTEGTGIAESTEMATPATEMATPATEMAAPATEMAAPTTEMAAPTTEMAAPPATS